jgi:hypothetical protein
MEASEGTEIEGGCLCGRLRYRLDPAGATASVCHCRTCRRAAGTQSVAWATVPARAFAWTGAAPASFASTAGVIRTHCAVCGTSLTYQSGPDSIDVTLGSLDDPEAIPPTAEIWLSHRIGWEAIDPERQSFPRGSAEGA